MKAFTKILTIKSDKTELYKVEKFLTEIFTENHLPERNYNKTLLCITEAVLNAIEHGNKNDSKKLVSIHFEVDFKEIYIQIADEGEGFNFLEVEDPTLKTNIKKESGRGIHIIKSLSDSLVFNEKGNSVQLKIDCT